MSDITKGATSKFIAFTWHFKEKPENLATLFAECKEYEKITYQLERGLESGKLHVQGCAAGSLLTKIQHKKILAAYMDNTVHVELCKKSILANERYCSKSPTKVEGPWIHTCASSAGKDTEKKNIYKADEKEWKQYIHDDNCCCICKSTKTKLRFPIPWCEKGGCRTCNECREVEDMKRKGKLL